MPVSTATRLQAFGAVCCLCLFSSAVGGLHAATAQAVDCFNRDITLMGTERADVLRGTPGTDVIWGGGGSDQIEAFGNRDFICAGPGNDRVRAGSGYDSIDGARGDDRLRTGQPPKGVFGGPGDDVLIAGPRPGSGPASHSFWSGMEGGPGADELFAAASGTNQMWGNDGRDVLHGSQGDDGLIGGAGLDTLRAGPGHDSFQTTLLEEEVLAGGTGHNRLYVSVPGAPTRVNLARNTAIRFGENANKRTTLIGSFYLAYIDGSYADVLIGNGLDNELYAGGGRNRVFGRAGVDTLLGGPNGEYLDAGAPDGPGDPDFIDGGEPIDTDTCLRALLTQDCEIFTAD